MSDFSITTALVSANVGTKSPWSKKNKFGLNRESCPFLVVVEDATINRMGIIVKL